MQSWVGQERKWEAESLCMACHSWSWRAYIDPGYLTPAEAEKKRWEEAAIATRGGTIAV